MRQWFWSGAALLAGAALSGWNCLGAESTKVPRFSVAYMDRSVKPGVDFYHFACGAWLKANPVPADKSRWSAFEQLQERNWELIHSLLEASARNRKAPVKSPEALVRDFYESALDTNRLEKLQFQPLTNDFAKIAALDCPNHLLRCVADFGREGLTAMFNASVSPDDKNSGYYAFELGQGGLGLPDRDYYLSTNFAPQRQAYVLHMEKMLQMIGETAEAAQRQAATILELESALAKASKPRAELRDPISNYHKFTMAEVEAAYPALSIKAFLDADGLGTLREIIVRQPEFFSALNQLVKDRPLEDWKTYLRWHVLRACAPYLQAAAEEEWFSFYGTVLSGQPAQEPRWQRAARVIDSHIGEALGKMYIEKYFPPSERARINDLISDLEAVYRDRLQRVDWMSPATRAKALAKFERFTQKIASPDKFRDYSSVEIGRDDYLGNVRRAAAFESKRQLARVSKAVDRSEWHMTPQTVNAYFNPEENEIVFPAGILQPPFFDPTMDDAVNYGAIGVVIGHEITHGYDDQGRKYDGDGNLNDWWTPSDAAAFEARAQKLVDQYNSYEALPGLRVNGKLTLGENLADLGGMCIAFDALERRLAKSPPKKAKRNGFTPAQRFFLSYAQLWRTNWREAELKRRLTVDPHSPGQFRAIGPEVNMQQFYDAFGIDERSPMWRPVSQRAIVW